MLNYLERPFLEMINYATKSKLFRFIRFANNHDDDFYLFTTSNSVLKVKTREDNYEMHNAHMYILCTIYVKVIFSFKGLFLYLHMYDFYCLLKFSV